MKWVHTKAEGKLEYTSLFYIPSRAPFDLWDRNGKSGVKVICQKSADNGRFGRPYCLGF